VLRKKVWPNFQRIKELFTQTIVTKLSKMLVWDPNPGSEIPNPEKTYSGPRIQGSRIPDPDPQHCFACHYKLQSLIWSCCFKKVFIIIPVLNKTAVSSLSPVLLIKKNKKKFPAVIRIGSGSVFRLK
jgi:hypothetical protein